MPVIKSASLAYVNPAENSDKVYFLQLVQDGKKYTVTFQYGRRNSTLNTGTKTSSPVDLASAEKIYNKVLAEKVGKGYQETASQTGSGYVSVKSIANETKSVESSKPAQPGTKRKILWTGSDAPGSQDNVPEKLIPQLLNPIDESEVEAYFCDDAFGLQPKIDGKHIMLRFEDGKLTAYNKKGIEVGYPKHWVDALSVSCILDGEAIGDVFHAFDCLKVMSHDLRQSGYKTRYERLVALSLGESIRVVPLATGIEAKKAMYEKLKAENKEGVVFKKLSAVYTPGRPSSMGPMLKHKFYSEASVIVTAHNLKNSVAMGLLDKSGSLIPIGNVTMIGHEKSPVNSVIDVKYLYAYEGGCFYQPTFIKVRDDVDRSECTFEAQHIKFKAKEE